MISKKNTIYLSKYQGFSLIEVMVTILIVAIGLLGLAGLQSKLMSAEMESYQRSHALILLQDMMSKIRSDESGALNNNYDSIDNTNSNINSWKENLSGYSGENQVGGLIGAQGCLSVVSNSPKTIHVSIAWQGLSSTKAPSETELCGKNDYGNENLRRVVSGEVIIVDVEE